MNRVPTRSLALAAFVMAAWSVASRVEAATITVTSTDMSVTPTQGDGKCTLIKAMENARGGSGNWIDCAAGDTSSNTINLQTGETYTLTAAWTNAGSPMALALPIVTRTLTINGNGSTITTTGSAGTFRVFYVAGSSLTLNNLMIHGIVLPNGADGALYNDNGSLTITSSMITDTTVVSGGSGGGAITSRACSAAGCSGTPQATLTVADSAIDNNQTLSTSSSFGVGAGINTYAIGSGAVNTTTIARSRFTSNTATNQGAAVSNAAYDSGATSSTTIDRSSMTNNTTTGGTAPAFGGGLSNFVGKIYTTGAANSAASLTVTTSTIASNSAANSGAGDGYGGGIFNEIDCGFGVSCGGGSNANVTLKSVTLSGNASGSDRSGQGRGAGIWTNDNDPTGSVTVNVSNSLVAGNLAHGAVANCRIINSTVNPTGYDIASDNSCGFANVFTEAQIDLASLNYSSFTTYQAPLRRSVAIDKVATCDASVDQIGNARPDVVNSLCDVGAIEVFSPDRRAMSDSNGDGRSDSNGDPPTTTPDAPGQSTPSAGETLFQISGDIPVVGDYDGDGKDDSVIWRPSTGLWFGPRTGASTIVIQMVLGQSGDIPVPCDYDGHGAVEPAIYRPSTGLWFGTTTDGATVVLNTNLGLVAGDIPVPADYDGDGKCDPAIMRPGVGPGGTNLWFALLSGGGTYQAYFGTSTDVTVSAGSGGTGKSRHALKKSAPPSDSEHQQ